MNSSQNILLESILEKTKEYLHIPAVIGFEKPIVDYLFFDFASLKKYEVTRLKDNKGLVVSKKGSKSDRVITAHIDRHGLVANDEGEFELAAFNLKRKYGEPILSGETQLRKWGDRLKGENVLAYNPLNGEILEEGRVQGYDISKNGNLIFLMEGVENLPDNTPIMYQQPRNIGGDRFYGQIDNAISVACLYKLASEGFDGTIILPTQEEIGKSWSSIVEYLQEKNQASKKIVTLDTTPYENSRAIDEGLIALRKKDAKGKYNGRFISRLEQKLKEQNFPFEYKDEVIAKLNRDKVKNGEKELSLGITELGRIVEFTKGEFNGGTIQLPTINYHSNYETTSKKAILNYYKAIQSIS